MHPQGLVYHWFYNVINNKVNDEILLFIPTDKNYDREKLKNSFSKLKTDNYKLIEVESIKSFNEVENNKNIIILGKTLMDSYLLNNLQHCVLVAFGMGSHKPLFSDPNIELINDYSQKIPIIGMNRSLYFYEKRNPITLLKILSKSFISNYILSLVVDFPYKKLHPNFDIQIIFELCIHKHTGKLYPYLWKDVIDMDIFYLLKSHILTARLAILIYKVTTLRLDDSSTRIGNYYREELGVKSKTVRLPQNIYSISGYTTKAYDLSHYFDSIKP